MAPVLLVSSNERLGAVAQMGERMTGSHEVRGSIPLSSTKENQWLRQIPPDLKLGRVDEFEVLTTKSMTCGKIGFATNSSKINGLVLIRQHALALGNT